MYRRSKSPLFLTTQEGESYRHKLLWSKPVALLSYISLILIIIYQEWGMPDDWIVLFIKLGSLLIFIPGFFQNSFRTYSWLCFMCLVYFIVIFPVAYTRGFWSDWLMTFFISLLFVSSMMTSRWLQYWRYYLQQKS